MPRPPAATPRPVSIISGSVTAPASSVYLELIPVTRAIRLLRVTALNATATGETIIERCTTAYTGGTSTPATVTPGDTTQPTPTLTAKIYTTATTGGGANPAQIAHFTTGTNDRLPALEAHHLAIVVQPGQVLTLKNNVATPHVYRFQVIVEEL